MTGCLMGLVFGRVRGGLCIVLGAGMVVGWRGGGLMMGMREMEMGMGGRGHDDG